MNTEKLQKIDAIANNIYKLSDELDSFEIKNKMYFQICLKFKLLAVALLAFVQMHKQNKNNPKQ